MAFDPALQRQVFSRFATGVTLLTTRYKGEYHAMTANSVVSLSLDPPLVLIAVGKKNRMHECLMLGKCYAVNILTLDQQTISNRFATPGPKDFSGLSLREEETGAPILTDALAYVDCRVVNVLPGGDHDIFIGEIVAGGIGEGQPLMFFKSGYVQL